MVPPAGGNDSVTRLALPRPPAVPGDPSPPQPLPPTRRGPLPVLGHKVSPPPSVPLAKLPSYIILQHWFCLRACR